MSEPAIIVRGVGKQFRKPGVDRPSTFKEAVLKGFRNMKQERFWGLKDVSFTVPHGRVVGVIGRNGAGKSTLLRLIGGVGKPEEGSIEARGRIGALLDLGAGMTSDLTGRENVMIGGVIAGMTTEEVRARFDDIVAFAELEEFIDSPIRMYSSGMRMRLAFAVAAHIDPDILLIDEVLAVGDVAFQKKCIDRIAEFKKAGCTIFLVSHDPEQIHALCDELILLRKGRMVAMGPTAEVMSQYEASFTASDVEPDPELVSPVRTEDGTVLEYNVNRFGSQKAQIHDVVLMDLDYGPTYEIASGEGLMIEFSYTASPEVLSPKASISIVAADETVVYDTNTSVGGLDLPHGEHTGRLQLVIERLDLAEGEYFITVALFDETWSEAYDMHAGAYYLSVTGVGTGKGVLNPPATWDVKINGGESLNEQKARYLDTQG